MGFRADCSILESPESCSIFNEVAGNENSDLFHSIELSDESIVCFASPLSKEQGYMARKFDVFLLSTSVDNPSLESMHVGYENGLPNLLQPFYLIPSPEGSFKVRGTGVVPWFTGTLLQQTAFSYAQLFGMEDSDDGETNYSFDVDLVSGRMIYSQPSYPVTNHFGKCFSFENEKKTYFRKTHSPEELEKLRVERASQIADQIAANKVKDKQETQQSNECVERSFKQLCPSCSHDDFLKRTVQAMVPGSTDSEMHAIFKKCR